MKQGFGSDILIRIVGIHTLYHMRTPEKKYGRDESEGDDQGGKDSKR